MPYFIIAAVIVIIDQLVKYYVRTYVTLFASTSFIPGLINLTYYQNTGAAFSILKDSTWLLTLISLLISIVLIYLMLRRPMPHRFGQVTLALILGGAVGNLIDRFCLGYVVDMFQFTFINFPVFNVADMSLVCGGILLCIYILFFYDKKNKSEVSDEIN